MWKGIGHCGEIGLEIEVKLRMIRKETARGLGETVYDKKINT